jgi:hypothetical protein
MGGWTQIADSANAIPVAVDFFSFGFTDDGAQASERVSNQIIRIEVEETGDNTGVFEGSLEFVMVNQLNILLDATYEGLAPIDDSASFLVIEDLTDEDSPRVNYLDLGSDGVSTQIADQQEACWQRGLRGDQRLRVKPKACTVCVAWSASAFAAGECPGEDGPLFGVVFTDPGRYCCGCGGMEVRAFWRGLSLWHAMCGWDQKVPAAGCVRLGQTTSALKMLTKC